MSITTPATSDVDINKYLIGIRVKDSTRVPSGRTLAPIDLYVIKQPIPMMKKETSIIKYLFFML